MVARPQCFAYGFVMPGKSPASINDRSQRPGLQRCSASPGPAPWQALFRFFLSRGFPRGLLLGLALLPGPVDSALAQPVDPVTEQREVFQEAWRSATAGDRATFESLRGELESYELFPYWQYEDYRARRSSVPVAEMAAFLESHDDWAFTEGLRRAWLKGLGQRRDWQSASWTDCWTKRGGCGPSAAPSPMPVIRCSPG